MDLILFSPLARPVTAEIFAAWPAHMRFEFAALLAERDAEAGRAATKIPGIPAALLERVRSLPPIRHALNFSDARVPDDEAVGGHEVRDGKRGGYKKRSGTDA